jgi:hypothetical protein
MLRDSAPSSSQLRIFRCWTDPRIRPICHTYNTYGTFWIGMSGAVSQLWVILSASDSTLAGMDQDYAAITDTLVNSMRKRCVTLRDARGGHTLYQTVKAMVYTLTLCCQTFDCACINGHQNEGIEVFMM